MIQPLRRQIDIVTTHRRASETNHLVLAIAFAAAGAGGMGGLLGVDQMSGPAPLFFLPGAACVMAGALLVGVAAILFALARPRAWYSRLGAVALTAGGAGGLGLSALALARQNPLDQLGGCVGLVTASVLASAGVLAGVLAARATTGQVGATPSRDGRGPA